MTPHELLKRGRAFIAAQNMWGKGWFAFTGDGTPVDSQDPRAVCFCSFGALYRVLPGRRQFSNNNFNAAYEALNRAVPTDFTCSEASRSFVKFNDHADTRHSDVLAMWDRAIAETA